MENTKKKTYHKKEEVIKDLFEKKCHQMWTNQRIKDYLVDHYGYTHQTAQTYSEDLWQYIESINRPNPEADLMQAIEYMEFNISNEPNSFVRLQWVKELNKVKGLHINRIEVTGDIKCKPP